MLEMSFVEISKTLSEKTSLILRPQQSASLTINNVKVKITNSGVDKFTNFGETSSQ